MKSILKEFFTFSRSQQIGVVILLILITFAFIFPKLYLYYRYQQSKPDISFTDKFETYQPKVDPAVPIVLSNFDPNTVSFGQLRQLGFTANLANTVIKYREAGGKFRQASDLSKIYNFPDSLYKMILPYIQISNVDEKPANKTGIYTDKQESINKSTLVEKTDEIEIFDLNTIDSTQLVSISGIGPVFAKRIINYRQFLGGFYKVSQLKEVYKLPEETYQKVYHLFKVDSSLIVKINLNQIEFNQLSKHPYLVYAQTKAILSYRKSMGSFKSPADLVKYKLVDSTTFNKLKPYLSVE